MGIFDYMTGPLRTALDQRREREASRDAARRTQELRRQELRAYERSNPPPGLPPRPRFLLGGGGPSPVGGGVPQNTGGGSREVMQALAEREAGQRLGEGRLAGVARGVGRFGERFGEGLLRAPFVGSTGIPTPGRAGPTRGVVVGREGSFMEPTFPAERNPVRRVPVFGGQLARTTAALSSPAGIAATSLGGAAFGPGALGYSLAGEVVLGAAGRQAELAGVDQRVNVGPFRLGPRSVGEIAGGALGPAIVPAAGRAGAAAARSTGRYGANVARNLPDTLPAGSRAGLDVFEAAPGRPVSAERALGGGEAPRPPRTATAEAAAQTGKPGGEPHARMLQIIADKEASLREPGKATQLPGVRQTLKYPNPSVDMPREIHVAANAQAAAEASLANEFSALRRASNRQLKQAWKAERPAYIAPSGGRSDLLADDLVNWLEHPDRYAPASAELQAARAAYDDTSEAIRHTIRQDFGLDVDAWTPQVDGGSYVPHIESREAIEAAGDQVTSSYTTASLSSRGAPAKTRVWDTIADRVDGNPAFNPELDLDRLTAVHDRAFAKMAGNETFKTASGKLNKLEVMELTHPALAERMTGLRQKLAAVRSSLSSVNERAARAVDRFLADPDSMTLADLASELDVRITRGPRAGASGAGLRQEIAAVRQEIRNLRPAWDAADTRPYVFNRQTFGYHEPDVSQAIDDVLRTKLNMGQGLLDAIDEVRMTAFAGDFSPLVGVQAPLGFLSDPVTGVRAVRGMVSELRDPGSAIAREAAENADSVRLFSEASGRTFGSLGPEMLQPERGLGRTPGLGSKITQANERMMGAVSWEQYMLWKADYGVVRAGNKALTPAQAAAEAWANVSNIIPSANPVTRGASRLQAQIERAPVVSVNYITAPAVLVKDAASGLAKLALSRELSPAARWAGLAGREQLALIRSTTLTGSAIALGTASYVANGDSVTDALKKVTDPNSRRFISVAIPGTDLFIPIGGPFRTFARAIMPEKVGEANGIPVYLPFAGAERFLLNKRNPVFRLPVDLARNKDFFGREIMKGGLPERILRGLAYAAESFAPLTLGAVAEGVRTGKGAADTALQAGGQLLGTNVYDQTIWEERRELRDEVSGEMFGKPYEDLNQAERKAVRDDERVSTITEQAIQDAIAQGSSFGRELADDAARDKLIDDFKTTGKIVHPQTGEVLYEQTNPIAAVDKAFLDGKTSLDDWLEADRDYRTGLRVANAIVRAGEEPYDAEGSASETDQAIQAVFDLSPADYSSADPDSELTVIDWDAYFTERDKLEAEAVKLGGQVVADYLKGSQDRPVKAMQDAAWDTLDAAPPQYEGMTAAQEKKYREFTGEIARVKEGMAADNISVSPSNVATVLSGEYGGKDVLKTWDQLQSDDGWKRAQNPDYWSYIGENLDDLRLFMPWLFDAKREKAMLGIETQTFDEPERPEPTRAAFPTFPARQSLADKQRDQRQQQAVREWLRAESAGTGR